MELSTNFRGRNYKAYSGQRIVPGNKILNVDKRYWGILTHVNRAYWYDNNDQPHCEDCRLMMGHTFTRPENIYFEENKQTIVIMRK